MSINIALFNALSGLQTNQAALQVTSNNVANANTEGYSRKVATQQSVTTPDGTGAGVRLSDIGRNVDDFLVKELRGSNATVGGLDVQDTFYQRLQEMFGTPAAGSSLSASIDKFATALQALAASPESASQQLGVVAAGQALAAQLNGMSTTVQDLRFQADKGITDAVDIVNTQLDQIADLNSQIARNKALKQSTADLEDQRDRALDKLSEQMDISYFTRDSGDVVIFTRSGRTLLDGTAKPLGHTAAASMSASLTYPGGVDGIDLGVDITAEITSGRIGALVKMRDSTLPALTAEADRLAVALRDEVNSIHNAGSGQPAAKTLTGSRAQVGTAASLTGTVRISLLNADGTEAFGAAVTAPATLDAAGFAAAINTALGGFGGASASQTGGVVTIGGGTYRVALSGGTVDPGGGAPVTNLSDFLHLNDFFVGTDPTGADLAGAIAVRSDIAADPSLLSRGAVRQDPVTSNYYVSAGDNTVAQQLAAKFSAQLTFTAAGGLPQTATTLAGYATSILSQNAADYSNITDQQTSQKALFDELSYRAKSISGVNMDEELANMVMLQNAYAASARVVTTASDMLDTLINLGR